MFASLAPGTHSRASIACGRLMRTGAYSSQGIAVYRGRAAKQLAPGFSLRNHHPHSRWHLQRAYCASGPVPHRGPQ